MVWKMFGRGVKRGSSGEQISKILRIVHGPKVENGASNVDSSEDPEQYLGYNTQGYAVYDRRMHEAETEKARMLSELRHERWNSSGIS
jgi:hypothetical protein